jgi:inner membrane protein
MTLPNHIVFGSLCSATILYINNIQVNFDIYTVIMCLLGSSLPDIDCPNSFLGRIFSGVSSWINSKYGHRTITHSILCALVISGLAIAYEKYFLKNNYYSMIFSICYFSHIILDVATIQGVQIFYPFSKSNYVIFINRRFRLKSGDRKHEIILGFITITLLCSLIPIHSEGFNKLVNRNIHTIRNVYDVASTSTNLTNIEYDILQGDKNYSGHGIIVKSTKTQAIIFDNNFITIDSNTRIHKLQATKTDKPYLERKISLSNISFSKMMNLIKGKIILYLGIKGDCNLVYKQDGKIIRGKILNLEHVYNPSISMENLNYGSSSYDIDRRIKTIEE